MRARRNSSDNSSANSAFVYSVVAGVAGLIAVVKGEYSIASAIFGTGAVINLANKNAVMTGIFALSTVGSCVALSQQGLFKEAKVEPAAPRHDDLSYYNTRRLNDYPRPRAPRGPGCPG
jgi:hypothetical protein